MIDNSLEEAKKCLTFDGSEDREKIKIMAQLAQALALIALVERLDKLTIKTIDKGHESHSLDVEISGSVTAINPHKW